MNLSSHPALHATTALASEAFDRDPLSGKSPKLKALWVGLATMGGSHSATAACNFARLTGITDAPDQWLAPGLLILHRMGLVGRESTPKDAPKTACTDGVNRLPRWVFFALPGPAKVASSRAFRTPLPERGFIVQKGDVFTLYLPNPEGDGWTMGHPGSPDKFPRTEEDVWKIWGDKSHTIFSPRF